MLLLLCIVYRRRGLQERRNAPWVRCGGIWPWIKLRSADDIFEKLVLFLTRNCLLLLLLLLLLRHFLVPDWNTFRGYKGLLLFLRCWVRNFLRNVNRHAKVFASLTKAMDNFMVCHEVSDWCVLHYVRVRGKGIVLGLNSDLTDLVFNVWLNKSVFLLQCACKDTVVERLIGFIVVIVVMVMVMTMWTTRLFAVSRPFVQCRLESCFSLLKDCSCFFIQKMCFRLHENVAFLIYLAIIPKSNVASQLRTIIIFASALGFVAFAFKNF